MQQLILLFVTSMLYRKGPKKIKFSFVVPCCHRSVTLMMARPHCCEMRVPLNHQYIGVKEKKNKKTEFYRVRSTQKLINENSILWVLKTCLFIPLKKRAHVVLIYRVRIPCNLLHAFHMMRDARNSIIEPRHGWSQPFKIDAISNGSMYSNLFLQINQIINKVMNALY